MICLLIFLLFISITNSEKVFSLSLQRTPLNTSLGLNFSMQNWLFLEFRFENKGIELYPTQECPLGNCEMCPSHYIIKKNESFECQIKSLKLKTKSLKVPKKNKVKFLNNATRKLKIFDGFFGLKFVKSLIKTNKIKQQTFIFNGTELIFGKSIKKPDIFLNFNKDFSINSSKFQVGGRFMVDSLSKIHLKPEKKGVILPIAIFRKVRTFLHFIKVKCRMSKNNSLKCKYPRSSQRLLNANMEFFLDNNQKLKIKVLSLLRNCNKRYCESLIFFHDLESIYLMGSLFMETEIEFDFLTKKLAFKSLNKTSNSLLFERSSEEIDDSHSRSWLLEKKTFLKVIFVIGIIIIAMLIGRKLFKCLTMKIEKSLPNYKKNTNTEENEPVNSFRVISAEIRNARKDMATINKPRVKKTIFG